MKPTTKWRIGFLGVTGLAIAMELFSIFDGNPNTTSWTYNIVTYIPEPIFWTVLVGGIAWVVNHFKHHYKKAKK